MANYDVLGNVVVVKFGRGEKVSAKRRWGARFLKEHKSVTTIVDKVGKFSGRLRTLKTKWIAGEKTKEVLYRENGCVFRFNVDTCYFSPRLSTERMEIASGVKRGESVLVMFSGVGPFGIVIGRLSKVGKVVMVELGRECCKYALENVKRNKLGSKVEVVQGDVRRKVSGKFDKIIMARPNLKDSFLDVGFRVVKKGGMIYYYGFYSADKVGELKELILGEARKARKKIKILKVKKAGEVGIRKFRYRVDIKVLN